MVCVDFDIPSDFASSNTSPTSTSSLSLSDLPSKGASDKPLKSASGTKKPRLASAVSKEDLGRNGGVYYNYHKNGRFVVHAVLPKIVKSDIRRSFPAMFTNIYNACDAELMKKYLDTFYCADMSFKQKFSGK